MNPAANAFPVMKAQRECWYFGKIVEGKGEDGDIELLLELADTISATALLVLKILLPVVSTIRSFRDEYEAHL